MNTSTNYLQRSLFMLSLLVLAISFYLQYAKGLTPCPLCLMQRLCIVAIVLVSGLRLLMQKNSGTVSHWVVFFLASAGCYFTLRQLWLMHLPAGQVPAC